MSSFEISFLDHVAIYVKNLNVSAKWYQEVLGLKRYQLKEWGDFPIFLLAGKSGVALFPADVDDTEQSQDAKNIKIDHFAFNVTQENFEKAKEKYNSLGIVYSFKDHHYFHSIYTKDPDGHIVELTTLVIESKDFYK